MSTWRYQIKLFRNVPLLFLGIIVLSVLYWSVGLLTGLVTREFFDGLSGQAEARLDAWTAVGLFAVVSLIAEATRWGYQASEIYHFETRRSVVRGNLFGGILSSPLAGRGISVGDTLDRARSDAAGVVKPVQQTAQVIGHLASVGFALYVMVSISPVMTVVALLPTLVALAIAKPLLTRVETYRRVFRDSTGRVTGSMGELLGAVQARQIASTEAAAAEHLERLGDARRRASLKERLLEVALESTNSVTVTITTGAVLLASAQMMWTGSFTIGDFALFVSYVRAGAVAELPGMVADLLSGFKQAQVSFRRLWALAPNMPHGRLVRNTPIYLKGDIPKHTIVTKSDSHRLEDLAVDGLSYHHPESERGVENVSLRLMRGSFTVVTGRIGAGKTTLLEALLCVLPKDCGEVRWNGERIDNLSDFMVPPRCAYTPQVPRLFSDTLRDNILLGLPDDRANIPRAIRLAVLERDVEQLERGLDTLVGPRGVRLSGGQGQRAAAARMFVRDPELLVFDDLSSALDVETEQLLWERLFELKEVTSLVVSHRHAAFYRADHIIVLREGRVEAEGRLDDLLDNCKEMQRLWRGELDAEMQTEAIG